MFKFSTRSLAVLNGHHPSLGAMAPVHPDLVAVVREAIKVSRVDMTVLSSTLRTEARQRELVAAGRSRTMRSLHLPQSSGFVHAVDLGLYEGGRVSWRPQGYFDIADAMQTAARDLNIPVTWGGCWAPLNAVGHVHDVDCLHAEYVARKAKAGARPFFDGPHFQLPRDYA